MYFTTGFDNPDYVPTPRGRFQCQIPLLSPNLPQVCQVGHTIDRYIMCGTLICGLWFGPKKPPITPLIKPVMSMLRSLYVVGTTVLTPGGIKSIRTKLYLQGFLILLPKLLFWCLYSSLASQTRLVFLCCIQIPEGVFNSRGGIVIFTHMAVPNRNHVILLHISVICITSSCLTVLAKSR